ncbi:hypothetical protein PHYSODRAFT_286521 [Phytophthora sojae]|uniref:RxLR effector protein n=2 Tax=Phytophthora sojae TaxID=67593 RepID=G4ZTP0_PHYSP|nr:hypothetical protein PHYSODRAFT_286521 [Phytophthora sojae]AEK81117.1 Avh291 [Phytophthora sojae]AEK81118.1 Avh291 [Phytophthora sojae]AEK81119.1 Avh291 [Phytophthora sojae]EGZ12951.1 hypothetical protein PHYSODRAFT_286521 [Phytophthora sojae]|eukprot:XP_009530380.1 hypothetical protein PHYSODRAFT_286521 [Phytophthora sojae]
MRFSQAILVAVFTYLASAGTLSAAEAGETKKTLITGRELVAGRSLRVGTRVDTNDDEERAWINLPSKVGKFFSRKAGKVQLTIPKDAPEEVLKKELVLNALPRKVRKPNGKYKHVKMTGQEKIAMFESWAKKDITSFDAWGKLGMRNVRENQLDAVMDSRHFADYLAYVKIYDDAVIARMKVGGKPPLVHPESTAAELTARAVALGINKREDAYAKLALGLGGLEGNALKQHTNYGFYEDYLRVLRDN